MRNRHGLTETEADQLLEGISESWNFQISQLEQLPRNPISFIGKRQAQAILSSLLLLQHQYGYDEIIQTLQSQQQRNALTLSMQVHCPPVCQKLAEDNARLAELQRLFTYLHSNTFRF